MFEVGADGRRSGGRVWASVDGEEDARTVAETVSFPIGYGVTREMANRIGAWWEDRRSIVQPSEFILDGDGRVRTSTYSSGPVGRIAADSAVRVIGFYESQK